MPSVRKVTPAAGVNHGGQHLRVAGTDPALLWQSCTLCSVLSYCWSSPEGLDSAVTNGDKPVKGAQCGLFIAVLLILLRLSGKC